MLFDIYFTLQLSGGKRRLPAARVPTYRVCLAAAYLLLLLRLPRLPPAPLPHHLPFAIFIHTYTRLALRMLPATLPACLHVLHRAPSTRPRLTACTGATACQQRRHRRNRASFAL